MSSVKIDKQPVAALAVSAWPLADVHAVVASYGATVPFTFDPATRAAAANGVTTAMTAKRPTLLVPSRAPSPPV